MEFPDNAPRREPDPPAEPSTGARAIKAESRPDTALDEAVPDAVGRARDALALAEMLHWFG